MARLMFMVVVETESTKEAVAKILKRELHLNFNEYHLRYIPSWAKAMPVTPTSRPSDDADVDPAG